MHTHTLSHKHCPKWRPEYPWCCWCIEVLSHWLPDNPGFIFWNVSVLVYTPTTDCNTDVDNTTHRATPSDVCVTAMHSEHSRSCSKYAVCLFICSSDPAFEIGILDIFGFEEFQRNGFEQVGKTPNTHFPHTQMHHFFIAPLSSWQIMN